jgi:predicted metal-dependent phosphotriesterase family hydrolase
VKVIRTVCGDIDPSELGVTQTHEHLCCDQNLGYGRDTFPSDSSQMILQEPDLIVDALADFREAGGQAIAEMTVAGWGRDVAVLRDISARTGVHVIATSGYYVEDCIPAFARTADVEQLTEFLLEELTEGADGTDIRPGILKSGVGRPVIEQLEQRCAIAVACAHKATGVPITTHTSGSARFEIPGGNLGAQHLDLFEAEGVDPGRVIIGHNDENADIRFSAVAGATRRVHPVRRDREAPLAARRDPCRVAGAARRRRPPAPAAALDRPLPHDRAQDQGRPRLRSPAAQLCAHVAPGGVRPSWNRPHAGDESGAHSGDRRRLKCTPTSRDRVRMLLEIKDLETKFYTVDGVVNAVNRISYTVDNRECLAIVGESGSGKTVGVLSILRLIPSPPGRIVGGRILFKGTDS